MPGFPLEDDDRHAARLLGARGETKERTFRHILLTAREIFCSAAAEGADGTGILRSVVRAAIQCSAELGIEASKAASAAGHGLLLGAEDVGGGAPERVRWALTGSAGGVLGWIGGVEVILPEPFERQNLE